MADKTEKHDKEPQQGRARDQQMDQVPNQAPNQAKAAPGISPKLLELLVCPVTRGRLEYDREAQELVSKSAKLAYPIRDGIPIMLPDEARPIE